MTSDVHLLDWHGVHPTPPGVSWLSKSDVVFPKDKNYQPEDKMTKCLD